jgi:nitrate/nitrite transporter NarK
VLEEPEGIKRDGVTVWTTETAAPAQDSSEGHDGAGERGSKYMNVGTEVLVCFCYYFARYERPPAEFHSTHTYVNENSHTHLGYFIACFDVTLMASSHLVITSYFHASNKASWLTTAFMITNTGFQPLWGRLSDTIGKKSVCLLVLTIFALTNLWCGLSNSIESFIVARAVCGIGAGGTMSMGLVVVNDLVKVEYRGTFISHISVAFGLGAACGSGKLSTFRFMLK